MSHWSPIENISYIYKLNCMSSSNLAGLWYSKTKILVNEKIKNCITFYALNQVPRCSLNEKENKFKSVLVFPVCISFLFVHNKDRELRFIINKCTIILVKSTLKDVINMIKHFKLESNKIFFFVYLLIRRRINQNLW